MNGCGYPKRLGHQVFADYRGVVYDFSKVKTNLSPSDMSVFDITPPIVRVWYSDDSDTAVALESELESLYFERKFAFSTWRDERFECPNIGTCRCLGDEYFCKYDTEDDRALEEWQTDVEDQPKHQKKLFDRTSRESFVEYPPITWVTILFIWLNICGDRTGMAIIFFRYHERISREIRKARIYLVFDEYFFDFDLILGVFQQHLFDTAITTGPLLRAITDLRIATIWNPEITPEVIDDKIRWLFRYLPRVQLRNIHFYGFRCGLVFGCLASYESEMRDRRSRRLERGSAAVSAASTTIANIPSINGVPVGSLVEPVTTGIRGLILGSLSRRRQLLASGVGRVEYLFLTHIFEEADEGLLASYTNDRAPRDDSGSPVPAYTPKELACFKESAWRAFKLVMNDEGHTIGFQLPPEVFEIRPGEERQADKTSDKFPRISVDNWNDIPYFDDDDDGSDADDPDCIQSGVQTDSDSGLNSNRRVKNASDPNGHADDIDQAGSGETAGTSPSSPPTPASLPSASPSLSLSSSSSSTPPPTTPSTEAGSTSTPKLNPASPTMSPFGPPAAESGDKQQAAIGSAGKGSGKEKRRQSM